MATSCVRQKCNTIFAGKPDLMAGCDWFLGWFEAADNPNFTYQRITCPAALTQRSGLSDPGNWSRTATHGALLQTWT